MARKSKKLSERQFNMLKEILQNYMIAQRELRIALNLLDIPEFSLPTIELIRETFEVIYDDGKSTVDLKEGS